MKKQHLSVLYVVLISLLLGSTILLSKPSDKRECVKFAGVVNNINTISNAADNDRNSLSLKEYENNILKKEVVEVLNNSRAISLQAYIIEDVRGQVSLNLKYRENGKNISKIVDTSELPEMRNMFRFRQQNGKGFRVGNMFFNPKKKKLYFCIEGKKKEKYMHTAVYSYDLNSSKAENIIRYLGNFRAFNISPDGKYVEFSYVSCPQEIVRNERSTVVILRCSDNQLVLNSDEDVIGDKLYIYSCDFLKWQNNKICELRQLVKAKDGAQEVRNRTMYFDVNTSAFIN